LVLRGDPTPREEHVKPWPKLCNGVTQFERLPHAV